MRVIYLITSLILFLTACGDDSNNNTNNTTANEGFWSIPVEQVRDGGPGKDGIPAINQPLFLNADEAPLQSNDLVIGIKHGETIKAYPHTILNWHEIVNDTLNNHAYTISFCPLTGSALRWAVPESFNNKTFGVSGLLYNSNLILYDRETDSHWSQMLMQSVNGHQIGTKALYDTLIETRWSTWRQMYPQTLVLSPNTGYTRNYNNNPYGDYPTNNDLLFPANNRSDQRLHIKTRILGLIQDNVNKVYEINGFDSELQVLNETLNGHSFVIVGSSGFDIAVAFERTLPDQTQLDFLSVQGALPIILQDQEGNQWDIFGTAISGPRAGQQLTPAHAFIAYWFAWTAFYPNAEIHTFN